MASLFQLRQGHVWGLHFMCLYAGPTTEFTSTRSMARAGVGGVKSPVAVSLLRDRPRLLMETAYMCSSGGPTTRSMSTPLMARVGVGGVRSRAMVLLPMLQEQRHSR